MGGVLAHDRQFEKEEKIKARNETFTAQGFENLEKGENLPQPDLWEQKKSATLRVFIFSFSHVQTTCVSFTREEAGSALFSKFHV